MKTNRALILLAGLLFAVSFFLPAFDKFKGYECVQVCLDVFTAPDHTRTGIGGWFYDSSFLLDNLLFPILLVSLFLPARLKWLTVVLSVAATLHVLSWLVMGLVNHDADTEFPIKIGYFVWLAAFVLLCTLIVKRKQT